ncbi:MULTISPECIES: cation diffusion facilitator family transporter [Planctomycetia]|jgi:cation diffusion facilitator family transporter|uniref:Cadmium, cobalt and zinc/H(+)-K(+) antiporter n=2 Tax=Planctomycetia TaxID=203683 RepID=A0A5C6FL99_9PLAN|nr:MULTISPECIES: cation diffusion facilitator family transporter [Planctomycetia]WRQ50067.1 cation diffusion facilitator family transporter [Stieleria sp. HD01]MCC9642931.1 cation diffusion facilitator family transporter [Rhodopirellula sp. JC740]MCC9656304.1 cation diffusion facilitator family transporter [Rhodopirellula sp. JC737]QDV62266.1 Cadmium, cobalt and zinc/H(+)-K(+) antiporter [Crateriforma conspicua]TWU62239.1 Cadmium, cobalt and zinc/H(+)-K(+) antiporter [Crateriforma conspicua]
MSEERAKLIRRGRNVEIASLIYNITEVTISLTAGFMTGSSALISWGVDSIVEANSAAFMIWQLNGEAKGINERDKRKRKKIALGVLSGAFTIAVLFICYEAISKFISQETASMSWWGIGILLVSLVVNPMLAWGKYRYGKKTDSATLKYDAIDTMICEYQTIVVLIGVGLVQWQGWWWADPVAALLIVPYVAWEAYESGRDAWQVQIDEEDNDE